MNLESPSEIVSVTKWDFFVNVSTILWRREPSFVAVGCVTNTSISELALAPRKKNDFQWLLKQEE